MNRDRLRHPVHGQVADDVKEGSLRLYLRGVEGDRGVVGDVEEVGALQMTITTLVVGVDAGRVDAGGVGAFLWLRGIVGDRAAEGPEGALGLANKVTDAKADRRVAGINCIRRSLGRVADKQGQDQNGQRCKYPQSKFPLQICVEHSQLFGR